MYSVRDHFSEASQASAEAQLALSAAFAERLLDGARRYADLNKSVGKASLQDFEHLARELLAARSHQELIWTGITQLQPALHKALAYCSHAGSIAAGTQAGLAELATTQIAATNREVTSLVAEISKNAPPGLNRVVIFMRTVYDHANAGYEQLALVARQVLESLESNLVGAANQFAKAGERSAAAARTMRA